jgi:hypothetical protein
MKLGTATSILHYYAIQDAVAVVAEAGYDGVDIWGVPMSTATTGRRRN